MEGKSLLVCIGIGGVFYHSLSRLPAFVHRRGEMDIMLIDPDVVEKKNALRQWGGISVGHDKVEAAHTILSYLTHCHLIHTVKAKVEHAGDITGFVVDTKTEYERFVVIHAPDNHMCRMTTHRGCAIIHKITGKKVIEITGGNTIDNGYAYSCLHDHGGITADWTIRHDDIPQEALAEIEQIAHPAPCGNMGTVQQSISSNHLTAYCIWELAEKSIVENVFGEMYWSTVPYESGEEGMKYDTKIWDNIQAYIIE